MIYGNNVLRDNFLAKHLLYLRNANRPSSACLKTFYARESEGYAN